MILRFKRGRIVFETLWMNWNEDLILPAQSNPLLISILLSFRLQMELAMNQVRLWSITNMEYSYDCFCFENKMYSSKYIVLIFPFIPTVYSRLVSWQKFNVVGAHNYPSERYGQSRHSIRSSFQFIHKIWNTMRDSPFCI